MSKTFNLHTQVNDPLTIQQFQALLENLVPQEALLGAALEINQGVIDLANDSVGSTNISSNAVTTTKLQDGSVTNAKLAGGITSQKIGAGQIGTSNLADGAVTSSKLGSDVQAIPTGVVVAFATAAAAPSGWLLCDGSSVSRSTYSALYAVLGTTWGQGDGSTTFNLPDYRGVALRGWDDGRNLDPGRTFAEYQADELEEHSHSYLRAIAEGGFSGNDDPTNADKTQSTGTTGTFGGSETRMKNETVQWIIKV